jgi:mandelate racemase
VAEALHRGRALEGRGLLWLEEPVRHDDLRGQATIAAALHLPLQIGENFNGPEALSDALAAAACDFVMPDVARIGGATGVMRAAAVAGSQGVEFSSHLMPELSVHLLAASQTAHWVEWVDWADAVLVEPLRPANGSLTPAVRPGFGLD